MRWSSGRTLLFVVMLVAASALAASLRVPAAHAGLCTGTSTVTCTFSNTGTEVQFAVPGGVTSVTVTAVGAPGGNGNSSGTGGAGGMATETLDVGLPSTLYVDVGGAGATGTCGTGGPVAGGFNGGGGQVGNDGGWCGGASGGGASGVYSSTNASFTGTPLVVAGGGGGGGRETLGGAGGAGSGTPANANGGDGSVCGGITGSDGGGGTQDAVGTAGLGSGGASGSPGHAGQGGSADGLGGGGGGGYNGGGGGGSDSSTQACGGSGGAGSSFADTSYSSGTPAFGTATTRTPSVTISYAGSTVVPYSRLRIRVSHGWTVMTWHATERVLGFHVYSGRHMLTNRLITSRTEDFHFQVHGRVGTRGSRLSCDSDRLLPRSISASLGKRRPTARRSRETHPSTLPGVSQDILPL